ncbi:MAG: GntR family transcriptional regulator [Bryobacteraceae bacterium]
MNRIDEQKSEGPRQMSKRAPAKLTQTERAYNAIKQAILRGEVEENEFISEADIIARYGIGRTPYREACNRLHHEGLLQVVPRRGYYIPEISFHAVCDLFEARIVLEDAIAQLAAVRATDEEIDELERAVVKPVASSADQNEFTRLIHTNTAFHLRLAKMTRNRQLVELLKRNLESAERLMYIELRSRRFRGSDLRAVHQPIIDALRTHDPVRVRKAILDDIAEAQGSTVAPSSAALNPELLPDIRRWAILSAKAGHSEPAPEIKRRK